MDRSTFFQLATIPWAFMEILLLAGLLILTLIRAVQQSEVGYENEAGFHYGNPEEAGRKPARSAHPFLPIEARSCHHSRVRENRDHSRHVRSKRE